MGVTSLHGAHTGWVSPGSWTGRHGLVPPPVVRPGPDTHLTGEAFGWGIRDSRRTSDGSLGVWSAFGRQGSIWCTERGRRSTRRRASRSSKGSWCAGSRTRSRWGGGGGVCATLPQFHSPPPPCFPPLQHERTLGDRNAMRGRCGSTRSTRAPSFFRRGRRRWGGRGGSRRALLPPGRTGNTSRHRMGKARN